MAHRTLPALVALALAAVLLGGCGGTEVEAISPHRGEIRESFAEPARTRLATTYPITMPVDGRIGRIGLEPGDAVKAGQTLVTIDLVPFDATVAEAKAAVAELQAEVAVKLDNSIELTLRKEADQLIAASDETLKAADAEVDAEKARSDRAARDLERKKKLAERKIISEDELDTAALDAETTLINLRVQEFVRAALKALIIAVKLYPRAIDEYIARKGLERAVLDQKLAQAQARLARTEHDRALAEVRSPIEGIVLERYELGEATLPAGQKLLLLGNLGQMEVVADVLTQDALRLHKGSEVSLEPAAGFPAIEGKVKLIEPAGFTKLSSLGVEQQRVNVIVSLEGGRGDLGVGYRVQARFFTGTAKDALIVPRFSVLEAPDRTYYVFKIVGGKLVRQPVELGLRSDLELQVTKGLSESDTVVARPDATMKEGMRATVPGEGGG